MRTIWKYIIPKTETFTTSIPNGVRFLSAQTQDGIPQMWFTVETTLEMEDRKFFIALTGREIHEDLFPVSDYLGTFQLSNGAIVCHLFEVLDPVRALVKTTFTGW